MFIRNLLASACVLASLGTGLAGVAMAQQSAAPAPAAGYSTTDTDIGTLLDNPQIAMARSMTLQQIKSFAGDMLNDAALTKIDAGLATIPKSK